MDESDFSSLLERARRGEEAAREELHRRYLPEIQRRLRRFAKNGLRRSHDTADLAQSVFVELLRHLPTLEDRGEQAFRHWLLTTAENKVRMQFRRALDKNGQQRRAPMPEEPGAQGGHHKPGPHTSAVRQESASRLQAAKAALKPHERQILKLRQQETWTYADIARCVGLENADAARRRYARAINALRDQWKKLSPP